MSDVDDKLWDPKNRPKKSNCQVSIWWSWHKPTTWRAWVLCSFGFAISSQGEVDIFGPLNRPGRWKKLSKLWFLYGFKSVLILLSWRDIALILLGLPEATRRLGTDEEGCVRVEQWSATRIFASASELWHTSETSIGLAGFVPRHLLTRFTIEIFSPNSPYIVWRLLQRLLWDMEHVWNYEHISIICRYWIVYIHI